MIKVTLLIYSGRENYSRYYDSHSDEANDLLTLFNGNLAGINFGEHDGKLGFSGFFVQLSDDTEIGRSKYRLPKSFYICDGQAPNIEESKQLGFELIDIFNLDPELNYQIIKEIESVQSKKTNVLSGLMEGDEQEPSQGQGDLHDVFNYNIHDIKFTNPATGSVYSMQAGLYKKDFWNVPEYIGFNNCYAYACNYASKSYPQPGRFGKKPLRYNTQDLVDSIIADGLIAIDDFNDEDADDKYRPNYVVSLYTYSDNQVFWDYHFYRVVLGINDKKNRFWGHKPGRSSVRRRDNSGEIIYDPCYCDRGLYTNFSGLFIVSNKVKII
ncbi:hypothetical protein FE394_00115 [Xenorhabdus sp. Reich]|uniref:Uncharacterized protein n=1 Tax=Xenorhabdus littoralis TaxID=2582835 RepID=A0ABU4SGB4_9GAMM|nr:hypothetical protein [Xenorhabdus sp. Reich]MDX7997640.1 hypothetical protein [Xenorhabdus sp. Reich]